MSTHIELSVGDIKVGVPVEQVMKALMDRLNAPGPVAQPAAVPRIGKYCHGQGGIYAGVMRGEDGQDYHMIVPTDERASFKDATWGCRDGIIEGALSEFDGLANTKAMAEAGSKLAKKILALDIDGHRDLYLPSRRECSLLYANVPELFEDVLHWTSTQFAGNSHVAWFQGFERGYQGGDYKGNQVRARAVRRFSTSSLEAITAANSQHDRA